MATAFIGGLGVVESPGIAKSPETGTLEMIPCTLQLQGKLGDCWEVPFLDPLEGLGRRFYSFNLLVAGKFMADCKNLCVYV